MRTVIITKTTYDQFRRTFQLFDAARASGSYSDNGVEYQYNSYGYLTMSWMPPGVNGQSRRDYYEVLEMDVRGNVKRNSGANGHTTSGLTMPNRGLHSTPVRVSGPPSTPSRILITNGPGWATSANVTQSGSGYRKRLPAMT